MACVGELSLSCTLSLVSETSGKHFTVAVFVVWEEKVLLHRHRKLVMWLPPGGHIEEKLLLLVERLRQ